MAKTRSNVKRPLVKSPWIGGARCAHCRREARYVRQSRDGKRFIYLCGYHKTEG